jgi:tRNA threonylcarbamoyladenosine biosynthesis protein TsaE
MKFKTNNPIETRELAKKIVQILIQSEKNRKHALVVSLEGELGTGKTTFTQGLAKALGVENWIKSPTFILMREHLIQNQKSNIRTASCSAQQNLDFSLRSEFKNQNDNLEVKNIDLSRLYHIDCYRLTKTDALIDIGLKDILRDSKNIVLIEWGEKLKKLLPQNVIRIKFKHLKNDQREIVVN